MKCVEIDLSGFVVESIGQMPPDCIDFVIATTSELNKLTYWADLSIQLDPGGPIFAVLVTAMFTSVGVVLGVRMVYDNLRTLTKEA